MVRNYKSPFKQFVKKAHRPLQLAIEDAVDVVCENADIGEPKKGDLLGVLVYKFKFNRQEYLLAYRVVESDDVESESLNDTKVELVAIDFYKVGGHENFYDELKRFLRDE